MSFKSSADGHKRFIAASALLLEPTTSREKFEQIRTLVKGAHPQLDSVLERCGKELSTFDKFLAGDVISLTAENLPETTEEEKKRKKALVFFIGSWNTLKKEIARVEKELAAAESSGGAESATHWRRIFNFAKGPFGIITMAAIGIVITMQAVSVRVTIHNDGCDTMNPNIKLPFSMPGLSLPKEPIPSGGSAVATVPGLTVTVDATRSSTIKATALGYSVAFDLSGSVDDVQLDGASLLGKETVVRLSEQKAHELRVVCAN